MADRLGARLARGLSDPVVDMLGGVWLVTLMLLLLHLPALLG